MEEYNNEKYMVLENVENLFNSMCCNNCITI